MTASFSPFVDEDVVCNICLGEFAAACNDAPAFGFEGGVNEFGAGFGFVHDGLSFEYGRRRRAAIIDPLIGMRFLHCWLHF
jgi:hypothetical protein